MGDSAVDEVKARLAIEDVVGEYVELKRAGRNFKGLSPFTSEKTPSFMVSPEKQIWHDFSSGKGGNMFSFVMEMEGLDFKGALEQLARKAGVDLSQYRSSNYKKNAQVKEQLYKALDLAANYYQHALKKNDAALDYVIKKRGLKKQTVLDFRVGYSPKSGDALSKFLVQKGFSPEEIKKAGLGNIYRGQMRDMFRGRLMIPLMDSFGKVVGFTARLLADDPNAPKYINTPATILYDKSRHVFGLHLAKESIRKSGFSVVVEGNMDVIASHQVDVKNVVATAGTAMTTHHLKEISRFAPDIRLCFDQDKAGLTAAERTIILGAKSGFELQVITVSEGKDPDELIQKSVNAWENAIQEPQYAVDWLIGQYGAESDLTQAVGKKNFTKKILPFINSLPDAVEQEHYRQQVAAMVGVDSLLLQGKLGEQPKKTYKKRSNEQVSKQEAEGSKTEKQLMSLMIMQPSLREYCHEITDEMLHEEPAKELLKILKTSKKKYKEITEEQKDVQDVTDYGKVISLLYEELYAHLEFIELEYEAARLQVRVIEHYVKAKKKAIAEHLQKEKSRQVVSELLGQAKELDTLLKKAREAQVGK